MDEQTEPRRLTGIYDRDRTVAIAAWTIAAAGLLYLGQVHGYGLFHVLVESFAVVVAAGIFIVAWNTRRLVQNGYLLVLGVAFLYVGVVDFLHAMTYKGMGLVQGLDEYDVPTQLWLIARYIQAGALLAAPALLDRKVSSRTAWSLLLSMGALTAVGLWSVLATDLFPAALDAETGLTTFKVVSEWVIVGLLAASAWLLWRRRDRFERSVLLLLLTAIAITIASELAFTLYIDPYGGLNLIGHLLKVAAFYLIYKAVVAANLTRPYTNLFRDLQEREAELTESEERFRATFEQATVGIAHIGLDGRWLRINHRLSQITGYEIDELKRRSFEDLTHREDLPRDVELLQSLLRGEIEEYSIEKRQVRADGSIRWVSASLSLLRQANGLPKYIVAVIEDIHGRKAAEERLRRAKERSEALTRIDAAINSTLDFDTIMQRAVVSGAEALQCETATVALRQARTWVPLVSHRFPSDIVGRPFTDEELPHAVIAERTQQPLAISDAANDPRVNPEFMAGFDIRSVLVVPLISRGECIGTIYFNFHSVTHWFGEDEMEFATSLASTLALAIENSRLYAAERTVADTLQAAMLAMPDELPYLEFSNTYRSSSRLSRIGGDFYDAFPLDDDRIAFTVGDVSGKGLDAATLTALARSTIRAFAYRDAAPSTVLTEANRTLARQIEEDRFVTAIFGVIDTGSGKLLLASAGHPRPLLCTSSGCAFVDVATNPPLGLFPEVPFEQTRLELAVGDTIVVFTDGLLDARDGDDFFGEKRLRKAVSSVATEPVRSLVREVVRSALSFAEDRFTDDVAVAAFRLLGREPHGLTPVETDVDGGTPLEGIDGDTGISA